MAWLTENGMPMSHTAKAGAIKMKSGPIHYQNLHLDVHGSQHKARHRYMKLFLLLDIAI